MSSTRACLRTASARRSTSSPRSIPWLPEPGGGQKARQVVRHRSGDLQALAGHRVDESHAPGVESLTGKLAAGGGELRIGNPLPARLAIERIADDRQARRLEVHPDLVGAAGDQPAAKE